jgi:hypothetical protein
MAGDRLYQVSYDGAVVWKNPSDISASGFHRTPVGDRYHAEFTQLSNGNYMAWGMENALWELPPSVDSEKTARSGNKIIRDKTDHKLYIQVLAGRLLEFDKRGFTAWSWNAADYLQHSDLYNSKEKNGLLSPENKHENAFYFDEQAKAVYISLGDFNRILKLDYPSGKVLHTYGATYAKNNPELKNGIFCGQKSCTRTADSIIYVFNNNTCNNKRLPTIVGIKETSAKLQKVWEYECTADEQGDLHFESGGNVCQLPGQSVFCCMGPAYSKMFIVDKNKTIIWSAIPEKWNNQEKKWKINPSYRASIVTRAQLEQMIWNATEK